MDSLTQAVLGAAVQGAGLGKYQGRKAIFYGALLGTLPDLDVFIHYDDPISSMTYHRSFSHSLMVLVLLAAVMTWIIKKRWPDSPYSSSRLFYTTAASLITHPLLDACTVYGTQLFWPLEPTPQQWSAVFIIDPIYTVPLLLAVIAVLWRGIKKSTHRALVLALAWSTAYLAWGGYGQYHHEQRVQAYLQGQGIAVKRIMATPLPFNTLAFRVLAQTDNGDYIEAFSGWLDHAPPEYVRLPQGLDLAEPIRDEVLFKRLNWFSDGWIRVNQEDNRLVVSDLRMGLGNSLSFRFVMAEYDGNKWNPVLPYRFGTGLRDMPTYLSRIWPRVWHGTPLPLSEWINMPSAEPEAVQEN
ncbi:metal-dependent hydrolase [Neisseria zalophi]|uniref:Metal-dependent hydrolase n=1 Tax=Neisseria zalophi TaxID=640030 RepID=A0A5J6PS38_9NEIS|nr:metal-dependent hydrolase [Neisseria zalophi]QEY25176.1 metal-dependent hydrolase [Neisseria zalophi]